MGQQATVTLNSIAYTPRGRDANGVAAWHNTALSAAYPRAVTEAVRGPSANGMHRVSFKLTLPKVASESDECGCIGSLNSTAICNIDVAIPSQFSAAERTDLQLQITALTAHAIFLAAVKDLEGAW